MHSIFIMEKNSGRVILYKQFGKIRIDENLLSGFLTALYGFARGELKESGIENIDMGGIRWVYFEDKGILYVSASEKEDSPDMLKSQLMAINEAFMQYFNIESSFDELKWDGNVHKFTPFSEVLEQNINDWERAKRVQNAAALMDLLDVYQAFITALGSSINLGDECTLNIMEMAFQEDSGSWDVQKLAELDEGEFKERLKNIFQNFLLLIKQTLGNEQLYKNLLRSNLFPILRNDWKRIRDLKIDDFIISNLLV